MHLRPGGPDRPPGHKNASLGAYKEKDKEMRLIRHITLASLLPSVLLLSCVDSSVTMDEDAPTVPMSLRPAMLKSSVTRAAIDGPLLPDSFTIYLSSGMTDGVNHADDRTNFTSVPFTYSKTDKVWHGTPAQYWPFGQQLEFMGIATDTTILPKLHERMFWDVTCCTREVVVNVPEEATEAEILYGVSHPEAGDHSPVDLDLHHAQCCLSFRLTSSVDDVIRLDDIVLNDVRTQGLLTVRDMLTEAEDGTSSPLAYWILSGSQHDFSMKDNIIDSEKKRHKDYEDYRILRHTKRIGIDNDTIYHRFDLLLPEQPSTSFTLSYYMRANRNCSFTDNEIDHVVHHVECPSMVWEMGTMYIFDINVDADAITVVPSIGEWDRDIRTIFVDEAVVELNTGRSLYLNEFGNLAPEDGITVTREDGTPVNATPTEDGGVKTDKVSVAYEYDAASKLGTVEVRGEDILSSEGRYYVVLKNTDGAKAIIPVSVTPNNPLPEKVEHIQIGAVNDTKREVLPRQAASVLVKVAEECQSYFSAYVNPVPNISDNEKSATLVLSGLQTTGAPLEDALTLEAYNSDGDLVFSKVFSIHVNGVESIDNLNILVGAPSVWNEVQLPPQVASVTLDGSDTYGDWLHAYNTLPVEDGTLRSTDVEISGLQSTGDDTRDVTLLAYDGEDTPNLVFRKTVCVKVGEQVTSSSNVDYGLMKVIPITLPSTATEIAATVDGGNYVSAYAAVQAFTEDGKHKTASVIVSGMENGGSTQQVTVTATDNGDRLFTKTLNIDVNPHTYEITMNTNSATSDNPVQQILTPDLPPNTQSVTVLVGASSSLSATVGTLNLSTNVLYTGLGCKSCDITLSAASPVSEVVTITIIAFDGEGATGNQVFKRNVQVTLNTTEP